MSKAEKSAKVKKSIDKKRAEERAAARAKFRQEHFKKQAPSTRKRMVYNAIKAKEWREKNFTDRKPPLLVRIKNWFEKIYRDIFPREKGLFDDEDIIR
jgi:hypothetical protein